MATDGQYSKRVISCDPRIRGLAICHIGEKCSVCDHAKKYEDEHETCTTDEYTLTFEKLVYIVCNEVAETVIQRNKEYGNSFYDLREETGKLFGNERIPLWIYETIKRNRFLETGKRDTKIDGAGYWVLEEVCSRIKDEMLLGQ